MNYGKVIRKMKVENNTMILIKKGSGLDHPEVIDSLLKEIELAGLTGVIAVVVNEFSDLQSVDERTMQKLGYVKIDGLAERIVQANQPDSDEDEDEETEPVSHS